MLAPKAQIDLRHADLVFIACYFVSGLLDSSSYNAWSCFVSMQTGNTVFLGLGASNQPTGKEGGWIKSLVSIISFIIGSFTASALSNGRTRSRSTLAVSFFIQSICIMVSAILIQTHVISSMSVKGESDAELYKPLVPLFLLAVQAGAQMAASRGCGFNELPTTVLTSVYYDLSSDPLLKASLNKNIKRNRRIAGVVSFLSGTIVGGWCYKASGDSLSPALWLAAGLKAAGAFGWMIWRLED